MKVDVLGLALRDYQKGNYTQDIVTRSSLGQEDVLPLPYLFRRFNAMPALEKRALNLAYGKVLDIGCGAGSHSLYLQQKGLEVTALDRSQGAIDVCRARGLKNTERAHFLDYKGGPYDTLLMMMNGIGIAGKLGNLGTYLDKMKSLLAPTGQILLDSSDIIYMFEGDEGDSLTFPENLDYYGEVAFTMQYKNHKGLSFNWLYIDFDTLEEMAAQHGLMCELIMEGDHYDYLARIRLS